MNKQTEELAAKRVGGGPTSVEAMAGANGQMLETFAQAGRAFYENAFALNQEVMRFTSERLQADMDALQTLSQFRDAQDITDFQSEFVRSTAKAYQEEISKLMEQSSEAAGAAWKPLFDSAKALSEGAVRK